MKNKFNGSAHQIFNHGFKKEIIIKKLTQINRSQYIAGNFVNLEENKKQKI